MPLVYILKRNDTRSDCSCRELVLLFLEAVMYDSLTKTGHFYWVPDLEGHQAISVCFALLLSFILNESHSAEPCQFMWIIRIGQHIGTILPLLFRGEVG